MPPDPDNDAGPLRGTLQDEARGADHADGVRGDVSRQSGRALRGQSTRNDLGAEPATGEDGGDGALSDRRRGASGRGRADGGDLGSLRGRGDGQGPRFDLSVPGDGYAWWYVDGVSADGTRAISIIAFIGSVFSPWYRWSGRREPENHVCLNVATYGPGGRFAMTDRGRGALRAKADSITIGPSRMAWVDGALVVDIDEVGSLPLPGRIRGQVRLTPSAVTDVQVELTEDAAHVWRPFAPVAGIEVDLEARGWQWEGHGYLDANFGTRALEADFDTWNWGRFPMSGGTACFYDAVRRDCSTLEKALMFGADGTAEEFDAPAATGFKRSAWQVARRTRADAGVLPRQVMGMLDAPFYSRSVVETQIGAEVTQGVHEALDLRRFRWPALMPMLAVRVPRRPAWDFGN